MQEMCAFLDTLVALTSFWKTSVMYILFLMTLISIFIFPHTEQSTTLSQSCFNTAMRLLYQPHVFSVLVHIFALSKKNTSLRECIHKAKIPSNTELDTTKHSCFPSLPPQPSLPYAELTIFDSLEYKFPCIFLCIYIYTYVCYME